MNGHPYQEDVPSRCGEDEYHDSEVVMTTAALPPCLPCGASCATGPGRAAVVRTGAFRWDSRFGSDDDARR